MSAQRDARVKVKMCSDVRGTTRLRNMCVRRGVLSTLSVAYKGIAIFCKRNSFKNRQFTIGDLAIGDLAIGCLGVHAIESLDVRGVASFSRSSE